MDLKQFLKKNGVLLLPFVLTTLLYFLLVREDLLQTRPVYTTVLKCLPIWALICYVLLKGFNWTKPYRRSQYVLLGLIFSCGGDALLNLDLFPFGMLSFGVAHGFYIAAFGWQPRMWPLAFILYVPVIIFCSLFALNLEPVLRVGVPIYSLLIGTMLWRAIARATAERNCLSWICAMGATLFTISDALIALTMFLDADITYSRLYIMSTYYAAQFAIALSTSNDGQWRTECTRVPPVPKQNKQI